MFYRYIIFGKRKTARYRHTDKFQDNIFLPITLSNQIVEGTLPATIQFMIDEKIDMSCFDLKVKNDETGRPAFNSRVLLKLILFAYSNGIISSRRIAHFAQENIMAMALCEGESPYFTVIADFIAHSGTFSDLIQKKHKLEQKIEKIVQTHVDADSKEQNESSTSKTTSLPEEKQKAFYKLKHKFQKIDKFLATPLT